jgi:hypothetical protein
VDRRLWWGSLTTLAFFVVPMLFAHLPTPAMAGDGCQAVCRPNCHFGVPVVGFADIL